MGDWFYNEDFKFQYLQESQPRNIHVKTTVDVLFRRIKPIEYKLGKDLYDFTTKEIIEFYKWLSTPSLESLMVMNNQFKLYTVYALSKKMVKDNQNHYAEIDNSTLAKCVNYGLVQNRIITRKELIDILESEDIENVSDRVIALAIFEGIAGKELVELNHMEPEDINKKTQMIKLYGGRELKISEKLMNWCFESANEYNFYNSLTKKPNKYYLSTDTRIIKRLSNSTVDTDHQRHKTINRRLDAMIDRTNCFAFTVGSLKESGRLEMIKELRESGMDLHAALTNKEMIYRYGRIPSLKRYCIKYGLD